MNENQNKSSNLNDKWELLENRLQNIDWNYEQADDFRYYQAGETKMNEINTLMQHLKTVDANRAITLFNTYSPNKPALSL